MHIRAGAAKLRVASQSYYAPAGTRVVAGTNRCPKSTSHDRRQRGDVVVAVRSSLAHPG